MSIGRRTFLKRFWKGLEIAGLVAVVGASRGDFTDRFDSLWNKISDYNKARIELYSQYKAKDGQIADRWQEVVQYSKEKDEQINDKWDDAVQYSKDNFPGIVDNKNKENNYSGLKELCRRNKKVYARLPNLDMPEIDTILLGQILKDNSGKFSFKEKNFDYDYIAFEQEGMAIEDALETIRKENFPEDALEINRRTAWLEDNIIYINFTEIKNSSRMIYHYGSGYQYKTPKSFKGKMIKELYGVIIDEVNKNPLLRMLSFFDHYKAFETAFVPAAEKLTLTHEVMHFIFPDSIKTLRQEKETFLGEARDPKFNSWTFIITDTGDNRYAEFYKAFKDKGYTKEDLVKMKPESRAKVAEKILDDL